MIKKQYKTACKIARKIWGEFEIPDLIAIKNQKEYHKHTEGGTLFKDFLGIYNKNTNTIYINYRYRKEIKSTKTLLHEMIHAVQEQKGKSGYTLFDEVMDEMFLMLYYKHYVSDYCCDYIEAIWPILYTAMGRSKKKLAKFVEQYHKLPNKRLAIIDVFAGGLPRSQWSSFVWEDLDDMWKDDLPINPKDFLCSLGLKCVSLYEIKKKLNSLFV